MDVVYVLQVPWYDFFQPSRLRTLTPPRHAASTDTAGEMAERKANVSEGGVAAEQQQQQSGEGPNGEHRLQTGWSFW